MEKKSLSEKVVRVYETTRRYVAEDELLFVLAMINPNVIPVACIVLHVWYFLFRRFSESSET